MNKRRIHYVGHPDWVWYLAATSYGKVMSGAFGVLVVYGWVFLKTEDPAVLLYYFLGLLFLVLLSSFGLFQYYRSMDRWKISSEGISHDQWVGLPLLGRNNPFFMAASQIEAVDGDPTPFWAFFRGIGEIIISGSGGKKHAIHGVRNFESVCELADVLFGKREGDPELLLQRIRVPGGLMGLPVRICRGVVGIYRWIRFRKTRKPRREAVRPSIMVALSSSQCSLVRTTRPHACGACGQAIPIGSVAVRHRPLIGKGSFYHEDCVVRK